ncbi:hypothetical protein M407DRAFT_132067 [Tulasnella calospora MUT 4182]|uniref:Uncharacterized protein n=1 Tax=Tulasnella calospora MUT 4182 TaxID=1051891 RepID=A0A0C3KHN9_9AGAM|nr:hypothetical protein M407DRAFT_132067 [Tulasnella calospora MUT 4182]
MPDRDPDLDVVVYEAARRLHTGYELSFGDIDATGVLPRNLVMEYGTIWDPLTSRTMLPWPIQSLLNPNLTSKSLIQPEPILSTEQRLSRMSSLMCANLSCIQPACPVHGLGPQPRPRRERTSLTRMIEACGKPCGAACFQNHDQPLSVIKYELLPLYNMLKRFQLT